MIIVIQKLFNNHNKIFIIHLQKLGCGRRPQFIVKGVELFDKVVKLVDAVVVVLLEIMQFLSRNPACKIYTCKHL